MRPLGLFGHEGSAQILTQIGAFSFLMVLTVEVQPDGFFLQTFGLALGDIARFGHLTEDNVATPQSTLFVAHGIEQRGILAHADEQCTFRNG